MTGLPISRRRFLKASALAGAASLLKAVGVEAILKRIAAQTTARVAWVQDSRAALGWSDEYAQRVNAAIADEMMDLAIKQLTGQTSVTTAWNQLFRDHNGGSGYQPGQQVAIKLNFNNVHVDTEHNPNFQTVNALLRHLIEEVGVNQESVILYDASRQFETYQPQFNDGIIARFPQVQINPDNVQTFQAAIWGTKLTTLLETVHYVINMPLIRQHSGAGVSLGFKNHFGSVETPSALHTGLNQPPTSNSSLVDLNAHETIRSKTILTIADAIYGVRSDGPSAAPVGDTGIIDPFPNSFFISTDPVAVDSVMLDYLANRDVVLTSAAPYYLIHAGNDGLGVYETALDYNYQFIDLVHCVNGTCPGVVPPTATFTPTATSTATATATQTPVTVHAGCYPQQDENGNTSVLCVSD